MNKLVINKFDGKNLIYIYENNKLVEQYDEYDDKPRLEGNIYLGKVKDIVTGMQSAFIDIGEEKSALIHIKDLIPKISDTTGNVNANIEDYDINKIIKKNDYIIVQIKRDCNDQKGPRVTKDIKLTGKYIVLMPFSKFTTVSQKIVDENDKKRLKKICSDYLRNLNIEYGIIIRTSAKNADKKQIENDINQLLKKWDDILEETKKYQKQNKIPIKIYDNQGMIGKTLTDLEPLDLEVYTNSKDIKNKIEKLDSSIDVKIEEDISQIELSRKIWLKCGGFITIDSTEALTAIDVNSGKFTGKCNLEDTVLKVNMEATDEIAKQIRLRDIGGIIIVDYIDMEKEEDKERIRKQMEEAVKQDRSKVQVLEFTKLGLLEITRKHLLGR